MKAMVIRKHGGPEVLEWVELPEPEPGPGEVRVRVRAVALNRLDLWVRGGLPHLKIAYPHLLGSDVAGEIDAMGPGVVGLSPGEKVLLQPASSCGRCRECLAGRDNLCREYRIRGENGPGGYAEKVVVPLRDLLPFPEPLSFAEAACVPLVFMTAWQMVVRRAQVRPGEWVLVQAGGSGVGSAAIQIARLHGARVVTTVGSDDKIAPARALGAEAVINYRTTDFVAEVRRLTGRRGVDVVIEHVGPATWAGSLKALAWGGRLTLCGSTTGPTAETSLVDVFFRQLQILGSTMGSKADLFDLLPHLRSGALRPVLAGTYPLEQARAAHERLASRELFGKLVLLP